MNLTKTNVAPTGSLEVHWSVGQYGIEIRLDIPEDVELGHHYSTYRWADFTKDIQGTIKNLLDQIPGQTEIAQEPE